MYTAGATNATYNWTMYLGSTCDSAPFLDGQANLGTCQYVGNLMFCTNELIHNASIPVLEGHDVVSAEYYDGACLQPARVTLRRQGVCYAVSTTSSRECNYFECDGSEGDWMRITPSANNSAPGCSCFVEGAEITYGSCFTEAGRECLTVVEHSSPFYSAYPPTSSSTSTSMSSASTAITTATENLDTLVNETTTTE
eukprot:5452668-Amphidinium_carterae.1